jgi:hypothetical protein
MAMKLNIDENIVERCGSGAALLFWTVVNSTGLFCCYRLIKHTRTIATIIPAVVVQ